jgi:hypothetical protein
MRLTKSLSVALPIWLAVVPAGSEDKLNWISAVELLFTRRLDRPPKLVAG